MYCSTIMLLCHPAWMGLMKLPRALYNLMNGIILSSPTKYSFRFFWVRNQCRRVPCSTKLFSNQSVEQLLQPILKINFKGMSCENVFVYLPFFHRDGDGMSRDMTCSINNFFHGIPLSTSQIEIIRLILLHQILQSLRMKFETTLISTSLIRIAGDDNKKYTHKHIYVIYIYIYIHDNQDSIISKINFNVP